jgi:hypothetical protein
MGSKQVTEALSIFGYALMAWAVLIAIGSLALAACGVNL